MKSNAAHSLEQEFQRKLNLPRRVIRVHAINLRKCNACLAGIMLRQRRDEVGGWGYVLVIGNKVARRVRQVEELGAELHLVTLRHFEIFEDREVEVPEGRTVKTVAARIPNRAERWDHKGLPVEPFRAATATMIYAGVGHRS